MFKYSPFLFFPLAVGAQTATQHVVASGGGEYTNTNFHISATIGELSVRTYSFGNNIITQGFQQPSGAGNPLPLNWLAFTGKLINGQTHLEWIVAQEFHNDRFEIERASNGSDFSLCLVVRSRGDNLSAQTYEAVDPFPYPGSTWYRLRQVDLDGNFTYSTIIVVKQDGGGADWRAYPNPALDETVTNIMLTAATTLLVDLYDVEGRVLMTQEVKGVAGTNRVVWDLHSLASGIYLLRCRDMSVPVIEIIKK